MLSGAQEDAAVRYAEAFDGMYVEESKVAGCWTTGRGQGAGREDQMIAPGKWEVWIMIIKSGLMATLVNYWSVVFVGSS